MFDALAPVVLALGLGALHGVGPDHLAAVATLLAHGGSRLDAARLALRFAAGHLGVLAVGVTAVALFDAGGSFGKGWEAFADALAGLLLLALGLRTLRRPFRPTVHGHAHRHGDGTSHAHLHVHAPSTAQGEGHLHAAAFAGALLALGGFRSLLLALAPLVAARSLPIRGACLLAFGSGIAGAMIAFAIGTRSLVTGERAGRWLPQAIGAATALLGAALVLRGF